MLPALLPWTYRGERTILCKLESGGSGRLSADKFLADVWLGGLWLERFG
jgi:hypothetical protein